MDRSWMYHAPRYSQTFVNGVQTFLNFAFERTSVNGGKITCPCTKCLNMKYHSRQGVLDHLICSGFRPEYLKWVYHGEGTTAASANTTLNEEMHDLINDAFEPEGGKDGKLRHPDALVWKDFDEKFPEFASDPRSVRIALASDGFNPFRTMNVAHSIWPVFLIPYNLPPWLVMKQPNIILSLIIPGPKGPGNKIDVYMQPLIKELKELWEDGVNTFDASTKHYFQLKASIISTISDFPGYANLSGSKVELSVELSGSTISDFSLFQKLSCLL